MTTFERIIIMIAVILLAITSWKVTEAKVMGGWIVLSETELDQSLSKSMVFVPDNNHEWKIKETPCLK